MSQKENTNLKLHDEHFLLFIPSWCCCSVAQSCPTLCNAMDHGMPGFLILQYLPFVQTHVHWVRDAHPTISGSSVAPFSSCHPWGISLTLCVLLLVLTLNHLLCGFLWMWGLDQMGYHLVLLGKLWDSHLRRLVYNWQVALHWLYDLWSSDWPLWASSIAMNINWCNVGKWCCPLSHAIQMLFY